MPFTFHSHSGEFCFHGAGKLEEVVLRAIELKFVHLGLSEHVPRFRTQDLYPEEVVFLFFIPEKVKKCSSCIASIKVFFYKKNAL